ncbi:hypothetical protein NDU88_004239 [Pleurodeles waltl]|uniref:Uncharacterized protein n=1 Tax=Pleurodeles waltl TaxID=8319 RepID=A0AAV7RJR7_PLEWA|nr:hypothetical protein NDU88_004239 [Pleurodeles waltl]
MLEWDAFTVVARGARIQQITRVRRILKKNIEKTERALANLSKAADADCQLIPQLVDTRLAPAALQENLCRYNFIVYAARFNQEGNKPGQILAWLARQGSIPRPITEVITSAGITARAQTDILQAFYDYYSTLYNASQDPTSERLDEFLTGITLPRVSASSRTSRPDMLGKASGLDGLPLEYYHTSSSLLSPRLAAMYGEALNGGELPHSLLESPLVFIPKPDLTQLTTYQPTAILGPTTRF